MMEEICRDCKGIRRVKGKDGSFHTCFKCLNSGKMDQHNQKLKEAKDFRIKL